MDFEDQLLQSYPDVSKNNILKFGDKITPQNILLSINVSINQSIDKCLKYFMIGLHFHEICLDLTLAGL